MRAYVDIDTLTDAEVVTLARHNTCSLWWLPGTGCILPATTKNASIAKATSQRLAPTSSGARAGKVACAARKSATGAVVSTMPEKSSGPPSRKRAKKEVQKRRPLNSFMMWSRTARRDLATKHPDLHNSELSRMLGHMWRELSPAERASYKVAAEAEAAADGGSEASNSATLSSSPGTPALTPDTYTDGADTSRSVSRGTDNLAGSSPVCTSLSQTTSTLWQMPSGAQSETGVVSGSLALNALADGGWLRSMADAEEAARGTKKC